MPRTNATTITLATTEVQANEWLIGDIHFNIEYTPVLGNISLLDSILDSQGSAEIQKEVSGEYSKAESMTVKFYRVLDGVAVDRKIVTLSTDELSALIALYPTGRDSIKKIAYDALQVIGETPVESTIT